MSDSCKECERLKLAICAIGGWLYGRRVSHKMFLDILNDFGLKEYYEAKLNAALEEQEQQ